MDRGLITEYDINKPNKCDACEGTLSYKGLGEYRCDDCRNVMYDDYGKVRNYLDEHRGATQAEVSAATGVGKNTIRQFLMQDKLEVISGIGKSLT